MLKDLFPQDHDQYSSLPLLGAVLSEFAKFLIKKGYPNHIIRTHIRAAKTIDQRLRKRKCNSIKKLTLSMLLSCAPPPGYAHKDKKVAASVKLLERYFNEKRVFLTLKSLTFIEKKVIHYRSYLKNVRCLSPATINDHCSTIALFLSGFDKRNATKNLQKLTLRDIEYFICDSKNRIKRRTLAKTIGQLRSFLRFLEINGEISSTLSNQIDTPRIYREEQLPRSFDWEIVCALLKSIDRSTPIGKRDYAILSLIARYGLRASEVVSLRLENIEWRENRLKVFQTKTGTTLLLPLIEDIGENILDYLRHGRPSALHREIFITHRAPSVILKPSAVKDIFRRRIQQSGLTIPVQGVHALRHSYAVHLLRQGVSVKTIGDLLGHRNLSSTAVYLRLNVEDLRTVPLAFPKKAH